MTDIIPFVPPHPARVTPVPEGRRSSFLPLLFGTKHLLVAENTVYHFMEWLSPDDYRGGLWDFYERAGQPLYLAPTSKQRYRIACPTNGYEGEVSRDAAGIIATMFALSHLSFQYEADIFAESYRRLYEHATGHKEAAAIFAAID